MPRPTTLTEQLLWDLLAEVRGLREDLRRPGQQSFTPETAAAAAPAEPQEAVSGSDRPRAAARKRKG